MRARSPASTAAEPAAQRSISRALAREVIEELAPLAAQKRIDLGLSEALRGDACVAIAEALRTLLSNLVDNAVRYTPAGGRVDVATGHDGDAARCWVRDNGPGIAPARARAGVRPLLPRAAGRRRHRRGEACAAAAWGWRSSSASPSAMAPAIELGPGIDGEGLGVGVRFPRHRGLSLP